MGKSGIIKVTPKNEKKSLKADIVVEGHEGTPKSAIPGSIIDHKDKTGKIDVRSFYGEDGNKKKDIHATDHGNPKKHPYGEHGEHAEDYVWDEKGRLKTKTTRELTKQEREENQDIL